MPFRALLLLCFLSAACPANSSPVIELTDDDFASELSSHETALVMFYAPWCGHCKSLKPEFNKAAAKLIHNEPPIALARVDCDGRGKATCEKYDVDGYPTLKIFHNGELARNYDGSRDAEDMVRQMKSQAGAMELKDPDALDRFLKNEEDVSVVGFFEQDSDLKRAFQKLCDKLNKKLQCRRVNDKTFLEEKGITDGIVLYRPYHLRNKFEDDAVLYSGPADPDAIEKFITKNYHGLVGVRRPDAKTDFPNPVVIVYYTIDFANNRKGTSYWRNRVLKVATAFKDRITFAISNKSDFGQELKQFGIDPNTNEAMAEPRACARDAENRKFVMTEAFSVEALTSFAKAVLEGKLEPHVRSQLVPRHNSKPVKVAVAKNFQEVVLDNGKDTMVEFYAPWCGHCRKFAKVYALLGDNMKNEDVEVVKMDATANDVPGNFAVRSYPTVFWLPRDAKDEPVEYDGEKKLSDLIKYVARHSTEPLKGYDKEGIPIPYKEEL